MAAIPPDRRTPPVKPEILDKRESHFSWLRTRLSVERTLMAWVRTGTAMIGFGFTIFQFFEGLDSKTGVAPAQNPGWSRTVSLALVVVGTLAVFVALREYRIMIRYLWSSEFRDIAGMKESPGWTPASMVATLLVLIGLVTLVSLIVRVL
jgi:putative membrane protein